MAIQNFNYSQAINQASQIDAVAGDMLNVANKQLQTTADSIGACWHGEASRQFINHCVNTQADIRTQAQKLQDLARRIREVARIIREAEERAAEVASNPSSGGIEGSGGGGGRF